MYGSSSSQIAFIGWMNPFKGLLTTFIGWMNPFKRPLTAFIGWMVPFKRSLDRLHRFACRLRTPPNA
jgi:hypothetical protein